MAERVYLDHAATSPLRPEAKAAMEEGFRLWANPSSPHAEGRKARAALEDARERIKAALGWSGELIFTSGASEALWIALNRAKVQRRIVSAVEHDAVFRAAPDAEVVPPFDGGFDPDELPDCSGALVALQHVNSESGTIMQPYKGGTLAATIRAAGSEHRLTGILLEAKGVMRHEYKVLPPEATETGEALTGEGVITSGIFSPTLGYSIGLARVPARWPDGPCRVDVRGKALPARLLPPPFVRHGKQVFGQA